MIIFPLLESFDNHDDNFDRQKLLVCPDVCLLQRVQGQRLQSWWGGNTKGEISTQKTSSWKRMLDKPSKSKTVEGKNQTTNPCAIKLKQSVQKSKWPDLNSVLWSDPERRWCDLSFNGSLYLPGPWNLSIHWWALGLGPKLTNGLI